MPLTPLTPTVSNLGHLRLCRDDLRQMVDRVRQLSDMTIDLEANNNKLDDVETDLPGLGERLSYFTLKAYRKTKTTMDLAQDVRPSANESPGPTEVLSLHLTRKSCTLTTTNPDLETKGVIADIGEIARRCRRAPKWFPRVTAGQSRDAVEFWWNFAGAIALVGIVLAPILHIGYVGSNPNDHVLSTGWAISVCIIGALILLFVIIGTTISRTVLLTNLRSESLTWWKRNRDGFVVGMITGLITGLLTGELLYLLTKP